MRFQSEPKLQSRRLSFDRSCAGIELSRRAVFCACLRKPIAVAFVFVRRLVLTIVRSVIWRFAYRTSVEVSACSEGTRQAAARCRYGRSQVSLTSKDTGVFVIEWNRVEGNWKQFKGQVKEKWGNLTDDDLDKIEGHRDQLEGIIQERYGIAKDQVRKDVDTWLESV